MAVSAMSDQNERMAFNQLVEFVATLAKDFKEDARVSKERREQEIQNAEARDIDFLCMPNNAFNSILRDDVVEYVKNHPRMNEGLLQYRKNMVEYMCMNHKVSAEEDRDALDVRIKFSAEFKYYAKHPRLLHESTENWIARIGQIKKDADLQFMSRAKKVSTGGVAALVVAGIGYYAYKRYAHPDTKTTTK